MRWMYSHISTIVDMRMSGWKIYIYGESIQDAILVNSLIFPTIKQYNCTTKIANSAIIERNILLRPAWGIAVIYLHPQLFEDQLIMSFISDLDSSLTNYNKTGYYNGAKHFASSISYRYDLDIPIIPSLGLSYEDYLTHYRGEFGEWNIPDNEDISWH